MGIPPGFDVSSNRRIAKAVRIVEGLKPPPRQNAPRRQSIANQPEVHWVAIAGTAGEGWDTTSATANTIVSSGTLTFTVGTGLNLKPGDVVVFTCAGGTMTCTVISYGGSTLTVSVTSSTGTGSGPWTTTTPMAQGAYPGVVYTNELPTDDNDDFDEEDESYPISLTALGPVWVYDVNNDIPSLGTFYQAIRAGDYNGRALFKMASYNYSGPCVELVTNVACVDGIIQQTKQCFPIPSGSTGGGSGLTGLYGSLGVVVVT